MIKTIMFNATSHIFIPFVQTYRKKLLEGAHYISSFFCFCEPFQTNALNQNDNMRERLKPNDAMVAVMKLRNSVGGQRIYPTSPEEAETAVMAIGIIGQFNEGMDRLNQERTLTERQLQLLEQGQSTNSQITQCYRMLTAVSDRYWQLALEKQQYLNHGVIDGPYTTKELGQLLIRFADLWKELKRRLDDQA